MTEPRRVIDLNALVRAVGSFSGQRSEAAPPERPEPTTDVELLDDEPSKVDSAPLPVEAWLDGIQTGMALRYREHRPLLLHYVAAGAVTSAGAPYPQAFVDDLTIVCAVEDARWLDTLEVALPDVLDVEAATPPDVARAAADLLGKQRADVEAELTTELMDAVTGHLAVDGTIADRYPDDQLLGVVKSAGHRWLGDESVLYGLPAGWRSPRFRIPAEAAGPGSSDRFSCYLRLARANDAPWNFALIRLESFNPDLLDGFAARCLTVTQNRASGDARWDRHLFPIAACERALRARRPKLLSMSF